MAEVKNVTDWAVKAGYSRNWLSRNIKKNMNRTPNSLLREFRFIRLVKEITKNPSATAAYIAGTIAPCDEKRLYNFLSKYYNTNFTNLRFKILGDPEFRKKFTHSR